MNPAVIGKASAGSSGSSLRRAPPGAFAVGNVLTAPAGPGGISTSGKVNFSCSLALEDVVRPN